LRRKFGEKVECYFFFQAKDVKKEAKYEAKYEAK
jgi:hypothetical protein